MKKFLLALLCASCLVLSVEAVPTPMDVVSLKAESTINLKSGTSQPIMDNLTGAFVPTEISLYGVNVTGTPNVPAPVFSIGWTAPDYNDLAGAVPSAIKATGNSLTISFDALSVSNQGNAPVIPTGTPIFIKVNGVDTSSTDNIQQIYINGFYLF